MTTNVSITNHGPGKVRIRHRDISLSARRHDSDRAETVLCPEETCAYSAVWDTRKLIIEEIPE